MRRVPRTSRNGRCLAPRAATVAYIAVGIALILVTFSTTAGGQSRNATPDRCPVANSQTEVGDQPAETAVTLQPEANSQTRVVNFGTSRGSKFTTFSVTAEPALPKALDQRLNLVSDSIVRAGNDKAESLQFPDPRFSRLRLSGNRKRISFDVCLDPPKAMSAGRYVGLITLDGPPGVESTAVTVTLNAKNGRLFDYGVGLTTLLALAILFYKEAAAKRTATQAAAGTDAPAKTHAAKWGPQLKHTLTDIGWWVPTLFALGSMIGVLLALWDNNPAWGDSGLSSAVALIGAGMSAIGAREIFIPRSRDTS